MSKQVDYTKHICEFLLNHILISVNGLEQLLQLPATTISQAMNGSRSIPEKHIFKIVCELANYGFEIDGYILRYDASDNSLSGRKWVKNIKTVKEGDGFAYIVKEYRWIAGDYSDL